MHVVTISASYGAAGSVVGPAVAKRLGVPFLDRAIPTAVASDLGIPVEEAMTRDESVQGWLSRLLLAAAPASNEWMIGTGPPPGAMLPDRKMLTCTQDAIRRAISRNGGVILGRAAAIVLRDHPTALHVRLDGDPDRRVRQAMGILGITEREARAGMTRNDDARTAYVRHFYRTDPAHPGHYHLVLDSTLMSQQACTDLIVAAVEARNPATTTATVPQAGPTGRRSPAPISSNRLS